MDRERERERERGRKFNNVDGRKVLEVSKIWNGARR
jgi:hypothetical protein